MNVTVNFGSVFATIKDESVLKEVANSISMQLKDAYTKRAQELAKSVKPSTLKININAGAKTEKAEKKGAEKISKPQTKAHADNAQAKGTKTAEKAEKEPQIALTDIKALKKLGLKFIPYSEKCILLVGNTKPIAKELGKMKKSGVFGNGHLKAVDGFEGGFGWLINKGNADYKDVCKKLHLKAI